MAVNGVKRRKLSHEAEENGGVTSKTAQKAFFKQASNWNLEQDYETRVRKGKKDKKASNKLPTRTADGRFEAQAEDDDAVSVESDAEWLEGAEDGIASDREEEKEVEEKEPEKSESQQIREAQEELARIAMMVNENPEDHAGAFKSLAKIGSSRIPNIQMLALVTQMTVYKDVIPGYRIRPAEDGPKEKISKEVRTLRQYEQALVSGYSNYIKELARCARVAGKPIRGQTLANVAIKCACTLVTSVPHFNFLVDLLKILVNKLSRRRIDKDGVQCLKALETLFKEDEDGKYSCEAVSLLSKMMKARDYQVSEQVLNLFLNLRLLSEFAGKGSRDGVDKPEEEGFRRKSYKKEFRTKRQKKDIKEQKALEKDMANADALVSHEERERMQSETLKMVFATYFRILKLRAPQLMGAVLEGLAKYSHLINQDFFGDLLEALKDLIRHSDGDQDETAADGNDNDAVAQSERAPTENDHEMEGEDEEDGLPTRNLTREALLCTVTAFALLAGQDAHNSRNTLHLDLSFFMTHLYKSLLAVSTVSDIENTNPSGPSTAFRVNVQTTTVLLLRSLTAILLPSYNIRSVPPLRLASFTKQLMTAALQLPDKSCQGVLALLGDVAHSHGKKIRALWNTEERKGDGRFNALSDSVEGSNPFAATVWEGELLRKHFSPKVREGVKLLEKGMLG